MLSLNFSARPRPPAVLWLNRSFLGSILVTIQLSWTQKYFMIENILQSFKNVATLLSVR